jgi:hypothetical protein
MNPYPVEIEAAMKKFHRTLNEKDKRRYAGIEALKLGHGGISYIANVLGCDRETVTKGIKELGQMEGETGREERIRQRGGGRKGYEETYPNIDEKFLEVIADHTAGDPMEASIKWTHLTRREIGEYLARQHHIHVSKTVLRQLLKKHGYRRRKAQKNEDERHSRSP